MKKIVSTFTFLFLFTQILNAQLTSTVDFTQSAICFGSPTGMVEISASGGVQPYTFTITPPMSPPTTVSPTTVQFMNLPAGTYNYEVEDANSDTHTGSFFINEPPPISMVDFTQPDTCNQCVGSTTINATGGTPPYQYSNDNGATFQASAAFNNLCEGNYNIVVVDQNGCASNLTAIVGNDLSSGGSAIGSVISTPATCNNGSLHLIITGGNGPFEVDWVTGDTLPMINNLGPGSYTATVTDSTGCQNQFSGTVADNTNGQCSTISGNIYSDVDNNCMKNSEPDIQSRVVAAQPGNYYSISDANGNYSLNVPFGNYTITYNSLGSNCTNSYNVSTSVSTPSVANIDFADSTELDVESILNPGLVRPVITNIQYLYTNNISALNSNGDIYYVPDPNYTVNQTTPAFDGQNGDTLFWTNATVNAMTSNQILIEGNTNQSLGAELVFCHGYYGTTSESNLANNHHCDTVIVIGSYDPNDKQVWPGGDIEITDKTLTYKIRFQNTGTDTAFNVFILDTLSQYLDPASFEFVAASHNCSPEIVDNNVLKFNFSNIMLVDSNTNEPLSHGHVIFRINQNPNNQVGDVIENTAGIYFDYNAPVITNTTESPIVEPGLSINEHQKQALTVYPNPTQGHFRIQFQNGQTGQLFITDVQGRILMSNQINNRQSLDINTDEWSQGIYLIQLKTNNETFTEKVIVTK